LLQHAFSYPIILRNVKKYIFTNTQEVTTQLAAPSKCIHSSDKKCDVDRTSTSRQNIASKYHVTLLHTLICRHAHASPEAGATGPEIKTVASVTCHPPIVGAD
jgi:hypothetical protein